MAAVSRDRGVTVCIDGLIAAGKTTFIHKLEERCGQRHLSCKLMLELFSDSVRDLLKVNIPMLDGFMLGHRVQMGLSAPEIAKVYNFVIMERGFIGHLAFIEAFVQCGKMDKSLIDWSRRVVEEQKPPPPDCFIYLDIPPETACIRKEGRGSENDDVFDLEFMTALDEAYKRLIPRYCSDYKIVDWSSFGADFSIDEFLESFGTSRAPPVVLEKRGITVSFGGLVAAGKTTFINTLVGRCQKRGLSCKVMPELFSAALREMAKANIHMALGYMFGHRVQMGLDAPEMTKVYQVVMTERSFLDHLVFMEAYARSGKIDQYFIEWSRKVVAEQEPPAPNRFIYLNITPELACARKEKRGFENDEIYDLGLMRALQVAYNRIIPEHCPNHETLEWSSFGDDLSTDKFFGWILGNPA